MNITQSIIDKAVNIATKSAMNGTPVSNIQWIPPSSATSDPLGTFVVCYVNNVTPSMIMPWDY